MSPRVPEADAGDKWGRDPRVRELRRVFAAMEAAEADLLRRLDIDPRDPRLRPWREEARNRFEGRWAAAVRRGRCQEPAEVAALYVESLARVVADRGGSM